MLLRSSCNENFINRRGTIMLYLSSPAACVTLANTCRYVFRIQDELASLERRKPLVTCSVREHESCLNAVIAVLDVSSKTQHQHMPSISTQ